jgi:hypothetical protein
MSVNELLQSARFVVDTQGNRQAVQLDLDTWEAVVALLEDLEDAEELRQARQEEDELIPWEQVKADYQASHPDADL